MQAVPYYTPAQMRNIVTEAATITRELMLAKAETTGEFEVLAELDDLMLDIKAENRNHRWYALDRVWDFLAAKEKEKACAKAAQAFSRLRLIAADYHDVLMVEVLEEAAAAKESWLS